MWCANPSGTCICALNRLKDEWRYPRPCAWRMPLSSRLCAVAARGSTPIGTLYGGKRSRQRRRVLWNGTTIFAARLRHRSIRLFPPCLRAGSRLSADPLPNITLRTMTSRWGSCTPKTGRIRLNLQLGLMDRRFLEYVLVHEMTHLWEHGHGAGFQRRMSAYLPDWRKLRRELNQHMVLR